MVFPTRQLRRWFLILGIPAVSVLVTLLITGHEAPFAARGQPTAMTFMHEQDPSIRDELQGGEAVKPLPVSGHAFSNTLQAKADPLHLKYPRIKELEP